MLELADFLQSKYPRLILPDYQKNCIVHIPDHIKYLHGLKDDSVLHAKDTNIRPKKTVLFTIDGFGYKQWQEHQAGQAVLARFVERGSVQPVTSMFPSSTAPSITGLSTGLTTQQHGLLEWWMYDRSSDTIITTLPFTFLGNSTRDSLVGRVDPKVLVSNTTLFQDLLVGNIKSYCLVSKDYAHSTYSSLVYAGSQIIAHSDAQELFANLTTLLMNDEHAHVNVYWDKIDSAGHTYGPSSPEYVAQVKQFFDLFEEFLKTAESADDPSGVSVQITADHGQITVDPEQTIWLNEMPGLTDSLDHSQRGTIIQPWGLQRDVYLKIKEDKLEYAYLSLRDYLQDKAVVLKSRDAFAIGLFGIGEPHPDFLERIGDLIIIPTGSNTVWYKHFETETFLFKGMHGGLSPDEVKVVYAECSLADLKP